MRSILMIAATAALLLAPDSSAQAQGRTRAGGLACDLAPTVGMIIGSRQQITCRFNPSNGGPVERYSGTISRGSKSLKRLCITRTTITGKWLCTRV